MPKTVFERTLQLPSKKPCLRNPKKADDKIRSNAEADLHSASSRNTKRSDPKIKFNPPRVCISTKRSSISPKLSKLKMMGDFPPELPTNEKTVSLDAKWDENFSVLTTKMSRLEDQLFQSRAKILKLHQLLGFAFTKIFDYWTIDDLPMTFHELPYFIQDAVKAKFRNEQLSKKDEPALKTLKERHKGNVAYVIDSEKPCIVLVPRYIDENLY